MRRGHFRDALTFFILFICMGSNNGQSLFAQQQQPLELSVRAEKPYQYTNEPLQFALQIRNISAKPIKFMEYLAEDCTLLTYVYNSKGEQLKYDGWGTREAMALEKRTITLYPGDAWVKYRILGHFNITLPDLYTISVKAEFSTQDGQGGRTREKVFVGTLRSPPINIRFVPHSWTPIEQSNLSGMAIITISFCTLTLLTHCCLFLFQRRSRQI